MFKCQNGHFKCQLLALMKLTPRPVLSCFQGQKAAEEIKKAGSVKLKVHLISLDLGNFESVRKFAKSVQEISAKIHFLVNNAGGIVIFMSPVSPVFRTVSTVSIGLKHSINI